MRIVMTRSNPVHPDPRVEKEAAALLAAGYKIQILAWDRLTQHEQLSQEERVSLGTGEAAIRRFAIKASFGGGIRNLRSLAKYQLALLTWLWKHRREYDVIHACDFDTVLPAFICAKLFGKRLVYDIFDYYVDAYRVPAHLKSFIERLDLTVMNRADAVILANEARIKQIQKSKPRKTVVIHNSPVLPADLEQKEDVVKRPTDKVKFVYVGILGEGRMLREIAEVFRTHPEWELHIAGFGELKEEIEGICADCSNLTFYGQIPYAEALKLESECDVLFAMYDPQLPNHRYSAANKLYEAMMLGKPIIVAENTGMDEIVRSQGLGEVAAYSRKSFESACLKLIRERERWPELAKRAQSCYSEHYSWSIMKERLLTLYRQFITE